MKRWFIFVSLCAALGLGASTAQGQVKDRVYVFNRIKVDPKTKAPTIDEIDGEVTGESVAGIKLTPSIGTKRDVPAADIKDITYDIRIAGIGTGTPKPMYAAANKADLAASQAKNASDRKIATEEAIRAYKAVLADPKSADLPKPLLRHLEYKIAALTLSIPGNEKEGLKLLLAFHGKHKTGWQLTACLERLGELQVAQEDYKGAVKTFDEILGLPTISPETKAKYDRVAADTLVKAKDYANAQKRLEAILKPMKPDDPQYFPTKMSLIKCKASTPALIDGAITDLIKEIQGIKEDDKYKKAVAHNTLGDCYLMKDKPDDALYEYLYVDVWYPVDQQELMRAYAELIKIYEKQNKTARAKEYQEKLAKLKAK